MDWTLLFQIVGLIALTSFFVEEAIIGCIKAYGKHVVRQEKED